MSASEWSLLVEIEAYLDILRRFKVEIDLASCEATSRFLIAWKSLGGQLREFQKQNQHLEAFHTRFDKLEDYAQSAAGCRQMDDAMGNRIHHLSNCWTLIAEGSS